MELDDLKQQWKNTEIIQQSKNQNIMEIIQNKSNGPVAALKRSYRRQMTAMAILPLMFISTNMQHIDKMLTSALFWFYMLFCLSVIIFAKLNYDAVKKMEGKDGMVKSNLEELVSLLEKRRKQNIARIRVALLFFILLTEVLPYFQNFHMLNKWHSLSPFIRFGAYTLLVLFQNVMIHRLSYAKYGQHINIIRMKELVAEMQ
jgi:hypothetical protein